MRCGNIALLNNINLDFIGIKLRSLIKRQFSGWQHKIKRSCIILSRKIVDQISSIYVSWRVQSLADTCRRSNITQFGLIGFPVHLVSLRDKHWRSILDTTPLNVPLRASKFVYLQL